MGRSPFSLKSTKMRPDRGMQAVIGGMIMKSVRRKEEEYFFEYDNVYNMEPDEWTEEDDLYDITDFGYLIEQIAEKVTVDASLNITDGLYVHRLSEAVSKTI